MKTQASKDEPGMDAREIQRLADLAPLAKGYRFEMISGAEVTLLVGLLAAWFPDISVGSASCYLREQFYERRVYFKDGPPRDVLVLLLKHGEDVVGMFSCVHDLETLSAYARLGVAAPGHRGTNLAFAGLLFVEGLGRRLGLGYAWGMATMKAPHAQRAFERAGWRLSGITPGHDREMVEPGIVKRVYEALYTRVLVNDGCLLLPQDRNLTPRTRAFLDDVFRRHEPCTVESLPEEVQASG